MPPNNLKASQQATLNGASPSEVSVAFSRVKHFIAGDTWLGQNNRYATDVIDRINLDHQQSTINNADMAEYIASSGPLHCFDGWIYLGRALDCHIRGDVETCIHLAYYAELRAAMSLLATQGIGIFNAKHVVVGQSGTCAVIEDHGTHQMVWLALNHWGHTQKCTDLIARIVRPYGFELNIWLSAMPLTTTGSLGHSWLTTWGLDLQRLATGADRDARNHISYRASGLRPIANTDTMQQSEFVRETWRLFEPSSSGGLYEIDSHLLRLAFDQHPLLPAPGAPAYDQERASRLRIMLDNMPLGLNRGRIDAFLGRHHFPQDSTVIQYAKGTSNVGDVGHHLEVLSRAMMLLRLATGASLELLRGAGLSSADLEFWWHELGIRHGMWDSNNIPDDTVDLWIETRDALDFLFEWEQTCPDPTMASRNEWRREISSFSSVLGECERIAMWGLAL